MRWGFCVFPSRLFVHILSLGANPSGFGTAFGRFQLFFGRLRDGFDGFRELRALLPVGAGCAQARVAYWRVCSARQTTARTRRRELRARPQARWRSDRRVLFAVAILLADCGNPAQIAARLSRLQRSSPNGGILFRTADFFPNCEVLLRTEDLFPNCGVPSRAAEFSVQLRQFLANAGALAGLSRPRACLAHLTAISAAEAADGKFGLRLVCWLTVGQRRSRRQTYGWRVAAEELG